MHRPPAYHTSWLLGMPNNPPQSTSECLGQQMTSVQDSMAAMKILLHTNPSPAAAALPTPSQRGTGSMEYTAVGEAHTPVAPQRLEEWKISGELGHLKP